MTIPEADTAVVRDVVPTGELPSFFDRSFSALGAAVTQLGARPSGPACAYCLRPPEVTGELEVGFSVDGPVQRDGDVVLSRLLPGGRVATVVHQGAFDGLDEPWGRLQEWVAQQGLTPAPRFWEVYLTEPTPDGDPAANHTALYLRLRDCRSVNPVRSPAWGSPARHRRLAAPIPLERRRSGSGLRDGQTGDGGSAADCPLAAHYGAA